MAYIINWSNEAVKTFDANIDYLMSAWTGKEIIHFIKQTNLKLINIKSNPKIYRRSDKNPMIRKASINKYITLYYKYFPEKNEVILLTFWHTRQSPNKLRY